MQRGTGLRTRMVWAFAAVTAVVVLATGVTTLVLVREVAGTQTVDRVRDAAQAVADRPNLARFCRSRGLYLRRQGDALYLIGSSGRAHACRAGLQLGPAPAGVPMVALAAGAEVSGTTGGQDYAGAPLPSGGAGAGSTIAGVLVTHPAGLVGIEFTRSIALPLALGAIATVLAAAVVAWLLSGRLVAPLARLVAAARRVGGGDFATRVELEGDGEVAEVATAFNEMAAALERERATQRAFIVSVGHELKTPLTAVQGYTEALLDDAVGPEPARRETLARIHAESLRLGRLVQDLSDLAWLGRGQFTVVPRDADVAAVIRDAGAAAEQRAATRHTPIAVRVSVAASLPGRFDPGRLRQVLDNLLDNAVRSSPPDQPVLLAGAALPDGQVEVSVTDLGPGIDPADLPRAFDRGYLWSRYRGTRAVGSGLGLSIVKGLCDAMGVAIRADAGPTGGTVFRLVLPAAGGREAARGAGPAAPAAAVGTRPLIPDRGETEPLAGAAGSAKRAAGR